MQKGNIGVTTENIFPIIKKFLYSDHEIFLRELVSNAVDATQKLKTLASTGTFKGELGDLTIQVKLDGNTLTISDRGIGLTAEEVEKYINQIAFSGANDFLEQYKDSANAIIGHFGLGFYSAFMVAKKVELVSRSYREGEKAVKWTCDGSPAYTLEETERTDRGTDIILHIDDDCKEFTEEARISALLQKYAKFLPVPVAFGKKKTWKDGKQVETDEPNLINNTTPLWTKKPSDLKDEDYKQFYATLYPMADEPLFWIHLNVDFPFNLTGILYFPKVKNNIDLQKNKIQLYCNQVFVTDSIEGIVPDFLTLLHGVIDSPDIPLNVSRSYLQSDSNVKKISSYITKKVADRLQSIFKSDRKQFEEKWDYLKLFIHYGLLTQEDFYEKATKFALLKNTDGNYYTYDEYIELIQGNQTDKEGQLIYLYASDREVQYTYIEAAKNKGYDVLLLDGQLDVPLVNMLEQKFDKSRFTRVDSDIVDRLIRKADVCLEELSVDCQETLSTIFKSQLPTLPQTEFHVEVEALGEEAAPLLITSAEYMRRMKEMAAIQPGMNFYGEMPDMYNIVLNSDHRLVKSILEEAQQQSGSELEQIDAVKIKLTQRQTKLDKETEGKKDEDVAQSVKDEKADIIRQIEEQVSRRNNLLGTYAAKNKVVRQLIDLALLQNNLLRGEALNVFVKRSLDLIK